MTLAQQRRIGPGEEPEWAPAEDHAARHPGALEYAKIGLVLATVTAVEVAIYYAGISHNLLVALLVLLSVSKFSLVILWFMHLRFDNRIFSMLFALGLLLIAAVASVIVSTLGGKLV